MDTRKDRAEWCKHFVDKRRQKIDLYSTINKLNN